MGKSCVGQKKDLSLHNEMKCIFMDELSILP